MPSIRDDRGYNQGYIPSRSVEVRTERRCDYMAGLMKKGPGVKVMEIGCGTGQLSYMLAKKTGNRVTGVDLCKPFIEEAKKTYKLRNLEYKTADFNKQSDIKKATRGVKYDYVVGNGILHHLYYNLDESLNSINGILKDGGTIIFQEPNFFNPYCLLIFNIPLFRKTARLEPGEKTFTKWFITKKMKAAGFEPVSMEYRDFLVPGVPDFMIGPSIAIGNVLEKIPVLDMLAQSLFMVAKKVRAVK